MSLVRISQETFDEVVRENTDEFDMSLEEALADARDQFVAQNVDLSGLLTSVEGFEMADRVRSQLQKLNDAIVDVESSAVLTCLQSLHCECIEDAMYAGIAARQGSLGAAAYLAFHDRHRDRHIASAALDVLLAILKHGKLEVREMLPSQGLRALCSTLERFEDDAEMQALVMDVLTQSMLKSEQNKKTLHQHGFSDAMIRCLRNHSGDSRTIGSVCKALSRYVADDDRRPGIHPNTFIRSRDLVANEESGALTMLLESLKELQHDIDGCTAICSALKLLAINDGACSRMADEALDMLLDLLRTHIKSVKVARHVCALLKNVSRNDEVKQTICAGDGLLAVFDALRHHSDVPAAVEQALGVLSSVTLRQPRHCRRIAELDGVPLVVEAMHKHPERVQVQRSAISTLRNLVSSHETKDLADLILELDAEDLIRSAHSAHPQCEDVAYAALRDLGCDYKATWKGYDDDELEERAEGVPTSTSTST